MIVGENYAFGLVEGVFEGFDYSEAQLVDPSLVFGEKHIHACILHAEKTNISKSKLLEFLLHVTGTRQISEAIKRAAPIGKRALLVTIGKNAETTFKSFGFKELVLKSREGELDAIEKSAFVA